MKNFARVIVLLFGSAGAHTYPKSGQVAPLACSSCQGFPPIRDTLAGCYWLGHPAIFCPRNASLFLISILHFKLAVWMSDFDFAF